MNRYIVANATTTSRLLPQQLGVLRNEGPVGIRRDGKRNLYATPDPEIPRMLETLYGLHRRRSRHVD